MTVDFRSIYQLIIYSNSSNSSNSNLINIIPNMNFKLSAIASIFVSAAACAPLQNAYTTSTPITAPAGAATWGNTNQSQSTSTSNEKWDTENHSGFAANWGNQLTNYGAQGSTFNNQNSSQSLDSIVKNIYQVNQGTGTGANGSQSTTVGASVGTNQQNQSQGSNQTTGFNTVGSQGNVFYNQQSYNGGSASSTKSSSSQSGSTGSSWYIPASYPVYSWPQY
jgi:hypothetical protein